MDLNAKDRNKMSGFHYACYHGYLVVAEMLVNKSTEFNIHLNTTLQISFFSACLHSLNTDMAEMLIQKSTKFHIDLNCNCKTVDEQD